MKIDFLGRFSDVQKLIAPPESKRNESAFARLVPPSVQEVPKEAIVSSSSTTLSLDQVRSAPPQGDIMASYSFPSPRLTPPRAEPVTPEPEVVKQPAPSVKAPSPPVPLKTPTVIQARRISSQTSFADLGYEHRLEKVRDLVTRAGGKHGIDPALSMAVVEAESSFNPLAVSSDGYATKGLFQLRDSTGKGLLQNSAPDKRYDPMDPELNVELGVGYLRYLHDIFSTKTDLHQKASTFGAANPSSLEKLAVAAFNAGEGRVAEAQRRAAKAGQDPSLYEHVSPYLPETTQQYVRKVVDLKGRFEPEAIG